MGVIRNPLRGVIRNVVRPLARAGGKSFTLVAVAFFDGSNLIRVSFNSPVTDMTVAGWRVNVNGLDVSVAVDSFTGSDGYLLVPVMAITDVVLVSYDNVVGVTHSEEELLKSFTDALAIATPADMAWGAAASLYGITEGVLADHRLLMQPIGVGLPVVVSPDGLLLPDHEGRFVVALAANMPTWREGRIVTNWANADFTAWLGGDRTLDGGVVDSDGGTDAYTMTTTAANGAVYLRNNEIGRPPAGTPLRISVWLRRRAGTGDVTLLRGQSTTSTDITASLTASWQRLTADVGIATGTASLDWIGVRCVTSGDAVDIHKPQIEWMEGQTDQNPADYIPTTIAPVTRVYSNENGNTVVDDIVNENPGAPLAVMPSLYVAPEMFNYYLRSSDITALAGAATATYDQVGITGEPNTATLLKDTDTEATQGKTVGITIPSSTDPVTMRAWVKKVGAYTASLAVDMDLVGGAIQYGRAIFNPFSGDLQFRTGLDHTSESEVIDGGGWWIVMFTIINDGDGVNANTNMAPAANNTGDNSYVTSALGQNIYGQIEVHNNKTIAQVRGSAPIPTNGVAAGNALITTTYDSANIDNSDGAIYLEMNQQVAGNILADFLRTNGTNVELIAGAVTLTQPVTFDTWVKIGIAYNTADGLMALNVNGVWSGDGVYAGTLLSGVLDLFRDPTGVGLMRDMRGYSLGSFVDNRNKIDEVIAV